jgi:hypothetical protein
VTDEPVAKVFPSGLEDEFPDGPATVVVTHRGCQFVLRFAVGDYAGEGELQELRVLPASDEDELQPKALRQFAPEAEIYLAYARSAMRVWDSDKGPPESRWQNLRDGANALREIAGPGRGLTDAFYRAIATEYGALIEGGEPHPVKAIGKNHHVTISAASRWITEARRRGLTPKKEAKSAS